MLLAVMIITLGMILGGVIGWYWSDETGFGVFCGFLVALFLGTIPYFGTTAIGINTVDWQRSEHSDNIISLSDKSDLHGSWVLGSGYINSEMTYYFYRNEGAGYKLGSVSASKALVVEDAETKEQARVTYITHRRQWGEWYTSKDTVEVHVPKGTIIKQMQLDTK